MVLTYPEPELHVLRLDLDGLMVLGGSLEVEVLDDTVDVGRVDNVLRWAACP